MKTSPLVSILMPTFNAKRYVGRAIQSILNQTYRNWELLICDDASTDATYDIIRSYANEQRIRIYRNKVNLKLLKTRNALLGLAVGELITFQDADDYSDSFRLERMVREFQSNPRLGLLSTQVVYVDADGRLLRVSEKPTDYQSTLQQMYTTNVVGGSFMMLKRAALDRVGGKFRSYLDGLSYQDYDLALLIAEKYEAYSLPDVLYFYRQYEASASKIISADRLVAKDVVMWLAHQRRTRGSDDVMEGNRDKVDAYFAFRKEPYVRDPSRVYREYAADFLYNRLHIKSVQSALTAVKVRPFFLKNWRTLQYCIRKCLTTKLYRREQGVAAEDATARQLSYGIAKGAKP